MMQVILRAAESQIMNNENMSQSKALTNEREEIRHGTSKSNDWNMRD